MDRPVVLRQQRRQRRYLALVIGLDRVAVLHPRPLQARQRGLDRDDPVGAGLRARLAGKRQQSNDVIAVGVADRLEMRIVLQIIVAIRQAEPALLEMRDVNRGVALVRGNFDPPGDADRKTRQFSKHHRQRRLVGKPVDARERIAQGLKPGRFHPRLVHERTIEIGELARLAAFRAVRVDALDHLAQLLLRRFVKRQEGVPAGAVGGNRRRGEPPAVGELPEILLGRNLRIDRREVDAGTRLRDGGAGTGQADRQSENVSSHHCGKIDQRDGDFQPSAGDPRRSRERRFRAWSRCARRH
jgi:hypothetical protein